MISHPVHYSADRPEQFTRLQLVIRILAFLVLGIVGVSLGAVFVAAYVGLPLYAAARLRGRSEPERYLEEDGPRLVRLLRWFAAVYSWFGLVVCRVPDRSPEEVVRVEIELGGRPTTASALWRLLYGLPSALGLWLLSMIGSLVWIWAGISILRHERVGEGAFDFLAGLERWAVRLLAYQASLVEPYPPFSFDDVPGPPAPGEETLTGSR
jgi:hypothetical protein